MEASSRIWQQDLELATRALAGERDALEGFVEKMRCIPRILAHRNARLGRPFRTAELEELAQEVFARIWERLRTYKGQAVLESWAYSFCAWTMLDHLRSQGRTRRLSAESEVHELAAEVPEPGSELDDLYLHAALASLAEQDRRILCMKQLEELAFNEIA